MSGRRGDPGRRNPGPERNRGHDNAPAQAQNDMSSSPPAARPPLDIDGIHATTLWPTRFYLVLFASLTDTL